MYDRTDNLEPTQENLSNGWIRNRFDTLVKIIPLTGKKIKQREYQKQGKIPIIDQGQGLIGGYSDNDSLIVDCNLPVIIFGDHTKIVKFVNQKFIVGAEGVKVLEPNSTVNPKLLYYLIQSLSLPDKGYARHYQYLVKSNICIPVSLSEQDRIASILSGVDALIEQTQRIIEKMERLKKGLMQQLLTRGIGHTKFKKVKWLFGKKIEIPEGWQYPRFSEVVTTNPSTVIEEEICPYIPMDAIDTSKPNFNYFEERNLQENSNLSRFQENDVLFARITPSTENGKTAIVENFSRKGIVSSELTVLRATGSVQPKYLYYYLKSHRIRQFAISQMMGSTGRQRVPDYVFKKDLYFGLPSMSEQQTIASILSGVDAHIQKNQEYKAKLEKLKKGLMQKLLTGQIRVKV